MSTITKKRKPTLCVPSVSSVPSVPVVAETPTLVLNKIYNEDCILGMKKIKSDSADIIICDPPYNIGKDFGNDSDKQTMDGIFGLV